MVLHAIRLSARRVNKVNNLRSDSKNALSVFLNKTRISRTEILAM